MGMGGGGGVGDMIRCAIDSQKKKKKKKKKPSATTNWSNIWKKGVVSRCLIV